jgi:CelD/BcsL family acetyltransferase involved in cellulose biosynthesis
LELERIGDRASFDAMRPAWDALRRDDPYATIFLSSSWLRAFLDISPTPWTILALREADRLVAALPISVRGMPHARVPIARELTFATAPFADYQGLLCRPEDEDAAVARFADALFAQGWERATFPDVADPRIERLIDALRARGARVRELESTPCNVIDLPATFDEFLARLSKPTRRRTTRPLRVIFEDLPDARMTDATPADADEHIDAMLRVNALRWGTTSLRVDRFRRLFRATFDEGCLRITIIWDGERPIAGGAAFVDPERGVYGAYMVGHDPAYADLSPGRGILGGRIREAIEGGFRIFDFMRGNEEYKSSYASRQRWNRHFVLTRPGLRTAALHVAAPLYQRLRERWLRSRWHPPAG